ncbi:MAG: AAA family ATPase [Chloroflexi bacterium]|nr:AAA family ATPase [Chloroflexota bacterium]
MLETGIPSLDLILGGGVPEGDVLLVVGPAGSGKTTLTMQMAFHAASLGHNVLYVSTLSEPPTKLIQRMKAFSFFDEDVVGERVFLLSMYPLIVQGLAQVTNALTQAAKDHQAALVIVDGLMTIRDLYPQAPEMRTFMYTLGPSLAALNATTVVTSSVVERPGEHPYAEFTMADGILEMGKLDIGTQTVRTIRASKMRGLANLLGLHSMRIDGDGITVFPRIESLCELRDVGLSAERVPLGLPELDGMMEGGLLGGSATVLAGSIGTGKTTACLQFILEGARRGQKSLLVGFRETPRQLIDKARLLGMDLAAAIEDGRVEILHRDPVDMVLDEVTWEILCRVESFAPHRLALDGVDELQQAFVDDKRQFGYMACLTATLRARNVTSLIVKEIPQIVGPELDFSSSPLAGLAENLVLMRYVEFRGELFRILSVLKMRDSAHDHSIRQYVITDKGMKVLERMESAEGILTGIARLPSEMRVKRTTGGRQQENP